MRGGGLGDPEYDGDDRPRLATGGRPPLRGDTDLERERAGLRMGERVRLRSGDLLGGLRALLGGDRRLGGRGERRRTGLPRILLGEALAGDLSRLGAGEGDRDPGRRLGGVPPRRRTGESARRRGGESSCRLGDTPLRPIGDLLRGDS